MARKIKIFTIYAWEDKNAMLQLLRHLKPLEEDFDLTFWQDDPINTGQLWKPQDESRLVDADIFLLLVSADFMNSEFTKQLEFKNIIDRYKENKSVVIPIILEYCRWEIDFKSDDYDFNLNELQVLPNDGKPLENWNLPDQAFNNIAINVKNAISSFFESGGKVESVGKDEKNNPLNPTSEQTAIEFSEKNEARKKAEDENVISEEEQLKKDIEEQQRLEANKKAEEELKLKKETEEKKRKEEEERLLREDKARRKAEQEGKESKYSAEKLRLKEEAEAKKRVEEEKEKRIIEEVEAEAKRIEEKKRLVENEYEQHDSSKSYAATEGSKTDEKANPKKRILVWSLAVLLALVGIWAISKFEKGSENSKITSTKIIETEVSDSETSDDTEIEIPNEKEDFSKLLVGQTHNGGIIFTIDYINKTGKIAHLEDAGPMPWKKAIKIDEQLGEGWRLPTLDELRIMHSTVGQGATNEGKFADELYWSATPYDANQARLLRFRDGNTSYHYNSGGTHRKFLVRAIRDFNQ